MLPIHRELLQDQLREIIDAAVKQERERCYEIAITVGSHIIANMIKDKF